MIHLVKLNAHYCPVAVIEDHIVQGNRNLTQAYVDHDTSGVHTWPMEHTSISLFCCFAICFV